VAPNPLRDRTDRRLAILRRLPRSRFAVRRSRARFLRLPPKHSVAAVDCVIASVRTIFFVPDRPPTPSLRLREAHPRACARLIISNYLPLAKIHNGLSSPPAATPTATWRAIVASSIHGTGAQKCRAIRVSGWTCSSTTAFGPNSASRRAASTEYKPRSGAASELSGCARGTAVSIANAVNSVVRPARV